MIICILLKLYFFPFFKDRTSISFASHSLHQKYEATYWVDSYNLFWWKPHLENCQLARLINYQMLFSTFLSASSFNRLHCHPIFVLQRGNESIQNIIVENIDSFLPQRIGMVSGKMSNNSNKHHKIVITSSKVYINDYNRINSSLKR